MGSELVRPPARRRPPPGCAGCARNPKGPQTNLLPPNGSPWHHMGHSDRDPPQNFGVDLTWGVAPLNLNFFDPFWIQKWGSVNFMREQKGCAAQQGGKHGAHGPHGAPCVQISHSSFLFWILVQGSQFPQEFPVWIPPQGGKFSMDAHGAPTWCPLGSRGAPFPPLLRCGIAL